MYVCPSAATRVDYAKTWQHTKIVITRPDSLYLQLERAKSEKLSLSDAVFDAEFQGETRLPMKKYKYAFFRGKKAFERQKC